MIKNPVKKIIQISTALLFIFLIGARILTAPPIFLISKIGSTPFGRFISYQWLIGNEDDHSIMAKMNYKNAVCSIEISGQGEMLDLIDQEKNMHGWYQNFYDLSMGWRVAFERICVHEGVTSLGAYAFWECNSIRYLELPASLSKIGERSLSFHAGLTEIRYSGTVEQWSNISFGAHWCDGSKLKYVICSDGICMIERDE